MSRSPLKREQTFRTAMRQNAVGFDAADGVDEDQEGLGFTEFCDLVRERESGEHTMQELRARFRFLDVTGSGRVEKHEV